MLDRILEQKALDTSVSIADWLPVLSDAEICRWLSPPRN